MCLNAVTDNIIYACVCVYVKHKTYCKQLQQLQPVTHTPSLRIFLIPFIQSCHPHYPAVASCHSVLRQVRRLSSPRRQWDWKGGDKPWILPLIFPCVSTEDGWAPWPSCVPSRIQSRLAQRLLLSLLKDSYCSVTWVHDVCCLFSVPPGQQLTIKDLQIKCPRGQN